MLRQLLSLPRQPLDRNRDCPYRSNNRKHVPKTEALPDHGLDRDRVSLEKGWVLVGRNHLIFHFGFEHHAAARTVRTEEPYLNRAILAIRSRRNNRPAGQR